MPVSPDKQIPPAQEVIYSPAKDLLDGYVDLS